MKLKNKLSLITIGLLTTSQLFAGNITNTLPEETDAFSIQQADKQLLQVNANGKTGLGTSQPEVELHIKNNKNSSSLRIENQEDSFNFQVHEKKITIGSVEKCTQGENGISMTGKQLTIDYAGHVGVNTPNPLAELHISNSIKGTADCTKEVSELPVSMILEGASKWKITSHADTPIAQENQPSPDTNRFSIEGKENKEVLTLNNDGKVGIDQSNPMVKLDVNGGIKLSSSLCTTYTVGTIQYDATTDKFQGCRSNNGEPAWIDLHL